MEDGWEWGKAQENWNLSKRLNLLQPVGKGLVNSVPILLSLPQM